jgi:hypothetical protein
MSHEFIYYDEDEFSTSDEECFEENMTGGLRMTKYAQTGNNPRSIPFHMAETLGNPSAGGKMNMKKIGKTAKKIGSSAAKEVWKEAKPILIKEGKTALKEGLKSALQSSQSQQPTEVGGKRPRGRPRKIPLPEMSVQDGGKRMLSKRLGVIDQEALINEGFQRGVEYAQQQGGAFSGGKFRVGKAMKKAHVGKVARKVAHNPIVQDTAATGVGLAATEATGNPMAGVLAAAATKGAMKGAGKRASARGALVSKIMKEKGLSLGQASKYVKDHNLF